jgi:hypothetical protein
MLENINALIINDLPWHEVDDLSGSSRDDHSFVVETDTSGEIRIRFGDGVTGSRPPKGDLEIRATYRSCGNPADKMEFKTALKMNEPCSFVRIQPGRVEVDADWNEPADPVQRYYGLYRGVVASNDDPLGKMRLTARIPDVFGDEISPWTIPCVPCGNTATPDVGDTVWILFERGHRDYPVWIGVAFL